MSDMLSTLPDSGIRPRRRARLMMRVLNHHVSVRAIFSRLVEIALLSVVFWLVGAERLPGSGSALLPALQQIGITMGLLQAFALYRRHALSAVATAGHLAVVYLMTGAILITLSWVGPIAVLPDAVLAETLAVSLVVSFVLRLAMPFVSTALLVPVRVLVVGSGSVADEVVAMLRDNDPLEGIDARGSYDPRTGRFTPIAGTEAREIGLDALIDAEGIGEVVIASADLRGLSLENLLHFKLAGMLVTDYVSFLEREKGLLSIDAMRPSWLLFASGFDHGPARAIAKRVFDVTVSAALLVLLSPALLLAMLAIRLSRDGPVFYTQERIGAFGRTIVIRKLRSMARNAEHDGVARWAGSNDPRVTRVGRIIRATRIDEIPQLISVLKGDMSFVGPRPERAVFVAQLRERIPFYDLRHAIKPGLSGWAQVSYPYGASIEDAKAKLRYDLYYIKNQSLMLDVLILLNTVRIVVFGTGAR
ncbi:MAG: TIGR03013 family XrtA/PEP-CTERM system glycosyltransferase [Lautropia sp.]